MQFLLQLYYHQWDTRTVTECSGLTTTVQQQKRRNKNDKECQRSEKRGINCVKLCRYRSSATECDGGLYLFAHPVLSTWWTNKTHVVTQCKDARQQKESLSFVRFRSRDSGGGWSFIWNGKLLILFKRRVSLLQKHEDGEKRRIQLKWRNLVNGCVVVAQDNSKSQWLKWIE